MDAGECMWTLDEDVRADGSPCKVLMLLLAKPAATEEEMTWKKGKHTLPLRNTLFLIPSSSSHVLLPVCVPTALMLYCDAYPVHAGLILVVLPFFKE